MVGLHGPGSRAESPGVRIQPDARAGTPSHYVIIIYCFMLHHDCKLLTSRIHAYMPFSPSPKRHTT